MSSGAAVSASLGALGPLGAKPLACDGEGPPTLQELGLQAAPHTTAASHGVFGMVGKSDFGGNFLL